MNLFELNNTFELEMNDLELRNDDDLGFNIFNDRNNFDDRTTGQFTERQNNDFLGRGRIRKHNKYKYSYDNSMNKCKRLILTNLFNDINQKLEEVYKNDIACGMPKTKLLMINQKEIANSNINFNKALLNKTIGDIFSVNISSRYTNTNYNPYKNKETIEALKNEQDPEKREYFNGLFNTTFLECLNNFIGKNENNKYIKGFKTFNELKEEPEFIIKKDKEYIAYLEYFLKKYEYNLECKKGRKKRVKKNK